MKSEIMNTTNQTPIEVMLKIDEEGYTTARNLYEFLELAKSQFSRWAKSNILNNPYAESEVDYIGFDINVEGNIVKDYKITSDFAKKLSMTSNSERGEQARNYFIAVEKKLKEKVENENKRIKALVAIVDAKDDVSKTLAINEYTNIIKQPLLDTIEKQQPMVDLAELRISALGCYTITDVNKTFGFKRGKLTNYAKSLGMLHKKHTEVNNKGEEYFKIYSKDEVHNQIGITEKGLQWIRENKEAIANFEKETA